MSGTHQVWKFPLGDPDQTIEMPQGARILYVAAQTVPTIWALVDPSLPLVKRRFITVGTGWDFDPTGLTYRGTADGIAGWMVFHVFEGDTDD